MSYATIPSNGTLLTRASGLVMVMDTPKGCERSRLRELCLGSQYLTLDATPGLICKAGHTSVKGYGGIPNINSPFGRSKSDRDDGVTSIHLVRQSRIPSSYGMFRLSFPATGRQNVQIRVRRERHKQSHWGLARCSTTRRQARI